MNLQRMTVPFGELKLAPSGDGIKTMSFSGYGAVFGNIDAYGDVIAPGAFAQFLSDVQAGKEPWPSMLSQHGGFGLTAEDLTPIGAWTKLAEDGKGLLSAGDLAPTPRGAEIYQLMKMQPRPAIDGLSIGYLPKKYDPRTKPEEPRRTLREIVLVEISPVTFPANRLARVGSVKGVTDLEDLSEVESYLRDVGGFSRNEAKSLIARIKAVPLRDAEDCNELAAKIRRATKKLFG